MPSRDHRGVSLRRLAVRRLLPLLTVSLVALLPGAAPAVAGDRPPMDAAREALRLTDQRLSLMDEVMVTKWLNRSPIEDRAQERVVLVDALAGVGRLRCQPGAHAALLRASTRLIRTRFVTPQRRAQLVDALLLVRRDAPASRGSACR